MARTSRNKKKNVISLDFTDVEAGGGGSFKIKEGPYLMAVKSVEDTESDKGNQMFKWTFVGKAGAAKGKLFYMYTVYDPPDSLWKLKSLLEALGTEVPDGALDLDLDEMVDLEMVGIVGDEEYQGKTSSRLQDFSPVDGDDGDDGEDEDDKKSSKKTNKKSSKDDGDDGDDGEKKSSSKKAKAGKGKKALEAVSADEVKEMDEDAMEELNEKYELEVDLSEHKTPRRKASALIAALEEKSLLETD